MALDFIRKEHYNTEDLIRIVALLRAPGGCPWDQAQTHASIKKNFIEETYEVIEDVGRMRSEVGVLVMTEQNGEVLRRLFREYELTYTELVQKDATVYVDKNAKREEQKVDKLIAELYEYYLTHVDQMSNFYVQLAYQEGRERAVTDYISGMSDEFAIRTFEELFVPQKWHVL